MTSNAIPFYVRTRDVKKKKAAPTAKEVFADSDRWLVNDNNENFDSPIFTSNGKMTDKKFLNIKRDTSIWNLYFLII